MWMRVMQHGREMTVSEMLDTRLEMERLHAVTLLRLKKDPFLSSGYL